MKLYFCRHGLAGDSAKWKGDDRKRPLTTLGQKQMTRSARRMAKLGLGVDTILSSPLTRAQQTAEIVAAGLGASKQLQMDERLGPDFNVDALARILAEHSRDGALLLVGHEPSFSQVMSQIIGGGRIILKKGGLARIDLADPASLQGELVWLLQPKTLSK